MIFEQRYLANGKSLAEQQGRKVTICVKVTAVDPSGSSLSCSTTDDEFINVALDEPLNGVVEGWVEVIGTVTSHNKIQCDEIIQFKHDPNDEAFDTNAYNMAVQFWSHCRDIYETGAK
ncbi:uncharacterized protein LOC134834686 [Culicoides brevitarsis]|uniref:uncharacterized protein LOC134834686 n=1 Tax=Culicoides brevitarsis TaxID=469753 RepID=UPI00307B7931